MSLLVRAGLLAAPQRVVAAAIGHAAALTLLAVSPSAGRLALAYQQGGALLVATVTVAAASAVDRRELRASAAADLCGASRAQRRLAVVAEAVLLALLGLPVGLLAGAAICATADDGGPNIHSPVLAAVLVPAVVAWFAGRARARATVVDATGDRVGPAELPRFRSDAVRAGIGLILVAGAVRVAQGIRSFAELDLGLGPLLVLAAVGLLLLLPPLVGAVGSLLSRARPLPLALAGSALRERRRLLAPAAAVGAVAAFMVAIEAVVGLGLNDRELARRHTLAETRAFTAGIGPDQALVGRFSPMTSWEQVMPPEVLFQAGGGDDLGRWLPDGLAERVRQAVPEATVAEVEALPVRVEADPVVPQVSGRQAAAGTPELLAALGLDDLADDLAEGRALALDPSAVLDGRVTMAGFPSLPATLVQDRAVPQHLPAVLVPPDVADDVWTARFVDPDEREAHASLLVVGRDRPLDGDDLGPLDRAVRATDDAGAIEPVTVLPGDRPVADAFEHGRLDQSESVVLDSPADVRLAVIMSLVVALVALGVALRLADLTGRRDDELLDVLGARARLLRRAVATQALVLALLAVPLGTAVGVLACRVGVAAYNRSSEVGPGQLPPIPFTVPVELVAGAVLVPLLATAAAWALARRRGAPDLQAMADGLAW